MVKNKKLIKCIQSAMCHDLVRGTYNYETVRVYFGFDNYRADVEQIVELSAAIMQECHGITLDKMEVCTISPFQSDRHARQTMICVPLTTEMVRKNLSEYSVL